LPVIDVALMKLLLFRGRDIPPRDGLPKPSAHVFAQSKFMVRTLVQSAYRSVEIRGTV
jgi:hypothetical protein